jgi:hypothetical protein
VTNRAKAGGRRRDEGRSEAGGKRRGDDVTRPEIDGSERLDDRGRAAHVRLKKADV